jgi:hypothetical protein
MLRAVDLIPCFDLHCHFCLCPGLVSMTPSVFPPVFNCAVLTIVSSGTPQLARISVTFSATLSSLTRLKSRFIARYSLLVISPLCLALLPLVVKNLSHHYRHL